MKRLAIISVFLLLMGSVNIVAQHVSDKDISPRWAIEGQVGANFTQKASALDANVPRKRILPSSNSGLLTKLHIEYYLPKTHFSLKAGYEHEELNFLKGDGSADLNQLMLGGRWYPAPKEWKVVPYVGWDVLWAYDTERGPFHMSASTTEGYGPAAKTYSYEAVGTVKAPRFSVGPMIGTDIYLFSSIAVQVEYGYRFGIASPYHVNYTESGNNKTSYYHGQLHRHVLSIGLKFTFPFKFTSEDRQGLLNSLIDYILY